MTVYEDRSDSELAQMAQAGDQAAEQALMLRYRRTVKSWTRPFFLSGGDSEDLMQEGMIGLLSAVRNFSPADGSQAHGASFRTFAEKCVRRRLISAARSSVRLKHSPLNDGISLDEILSEESQSIPSHVWQQFHRSPEDQVLAREFQDEFAAMSTRDLSPFEAEVLKAYLQGYSYEEIAGLCRRSVKSVDNAVQRIRRKMARHFHLGDFSES